MMKKILPVAVATLVLVLSAGGGFAEPPKPVKEGTSNASGIDYDQFQQLPDADMATVTGGAWWSGGCTGVHSRGRFVLVIGLHGMSLHVSWLPAK